jgi:hypothetical protein
VRQPVRERGGDLSILTNQRLCVNAVPDGCAERYGQTLSTYVSAAIEEAVDHLVEPGPLVKVSWHRAAARSSDPSLLCVIWTSGGEPPARVDVDEGTDAVTVTLYERERPDRSADGTPIAYAPVAVTRHVDVRLDEPLGERAVIDGSTGLQPDRSPSGVLDALNRADARQIDVDGLALVLVATGEALDPARWTRRRPVAPDEPPPEPTPIAIDFFSESTRIEP